MESKKKNPKSLPGNNNKDSQNGAGARSMAESETYRVNSALLNRMAATDIGVIFLDPELRVKLYTPRAEELFSLTADDIDRPFNQIASCLDCEDLPANCHEVLATGQMVEKELWDDKGRCYMVRILSYHTFNSDVEGVVITFVDITTRVETEKRLRWLATVVESSNDAIFSFAFDQKIISWNAGAEEIFGYLAEEAIGHPLSMLTQAGRESEQARLLGKTWKGETIENFETVQIQKGGIPIDISLTLAPIEDENHKILGISATVSDITKRLKADESLRKSEELRRLLVESATDFAMFTLTVDGMVNSWNTGAERVFGFTEDEIIGKYGGILFTPEDRANGVPEQEMESAAKTGRAEDERYHIRKDGSRFYASGVMTPLLDGGLHGFAKVARDLTSKRQAEEQLRRAQDDLNQGLEDKVVARTAELAQSNESLRLEIVERLRAEEARVWLLQRIVTTQEDERRRIARDLHDQLGQRLTALRLKIASLKEVSGASEEFAERVVRIEEIGLRLDAEVSFLAWELRPAVLDDLGLVIAVGDYVKEWSRHFAIPAEFESAGLKNRRLSPEAETNLYRITQEALNNTLKHAKATSVSVLLEKRQKNVVLIIEDNGIGFNPAKKKRADKGGRGLGLIGMRERAAIEGGTMEIESTPGNGTTVFVRVPFEPTKKSHAK